ncbi:CDC73-domain-containing protein, partial [Thelephora ganbajun]
MSSGTEDALLALRNAIKSQSTVSYIANGEPVSSLAAATHLVLSSQTLSKSTPTRFRKPGVSGSDPTNSPADFFTLDAIYVTWLLKDASVTEYMKQARDNGLTGGLVSVTERKSVVDWLEGKAADHPNITPLASESTTPPGTPPSRTLTLPPTTSPQFKAPDSFAPSTKRRYVADPQDIEIVKKIKLNEIELQDRNTVLRGIKNNNFTSIRSMFTEKLKKYKVASKSGSTPAATTPDPKMQAKKAKNLYPIIMISSSPTALITMHNVKRFLQESTFEPSQEARARAISEGNVKPDDMIPIYRKRTHIDSSGREMESHVRYVVVDSVEALSKFGVDPWDRVVCVMTTGQEWQFKNYKWKDPKQLFHHVKGIYVTWAHDPQNPKVKDWNVTELKIDAHRRHVDKSVVAHFWKSIDTWTQMNKPWLMQS